jgi:hypothetical protein
MQTASGMYQLMLRSVGKPGTLVMAKKVPANAMLWKIGIASVGRKVDGSRRVLRRARVDSAEALRIVVPANSEENDVLIVQQSFVRVLVRQQ